MELTTAIKLLISLAIGAAIGLEREVHERHEPHGPEEPKHASKAYIGVRTFSLITALGTISGLLYHDYFSIFLSITIAFFSLTIVHYILNSWLSKDIGTTTEMATIFCYLIGLFIGLEVFPTILTIAIGVVLMLILATKSQIEGIVADVQRRELMAFIGYSLIALVVLPFLPNASYTLGEIPYIEQIAGTLKLDLNQWGDLEIINPFTTWLIVAIITGVEFTGYVLERSIGKGKGLILTSLVGGFVSSTATTQSLAVQSKETKKIDMLVASALLATFASFFSATLILLPINPEYVGYIFPTLIILIVGFGIATFVFMRMDKTKKDNKIEETIDRNEVFSLKPALIFAVLYIAIKLLSRIALELFGETGFLITSALAAVTGIDAVLINVAQLARDQIEPFTGVLAFILVNAVNLIGKTTFVFLQAKREFAVKYAITIAVIILLSFAGLLFV